MVKSSILTIWSQYLELVVAESLHQAILNQSTKVVQLHKKRTFHLYHFIHDNNTFSVNVHVHIFITYETFPIFNGIIEAAF